jgi:NAD(P)-dependent dehydrogenase (short-subunit alcohol dehydrogenase family)
LFAFANKIIEDFDPTMEYAFGLTPAYSVSKALLTIGTFLLHKESLARNVSKCKIFAVCPGNVVSPMSTPEELLDATSPDEAARSILSLLQRLSERSADGLLYRGGHAIPW